MQEVEYYLRNLETKASGPNGIPARLLIKSALVLLIALNLSELFNLSLRKAKRSITGTIYNNIVTGLLSQRCQDNL